MTRRPAGFHHLLLIERAIPANMSAAPSKSASGRKHHNRWLLLIAADKFLHALLFVIIGFGARRLLHKDIADEIITVADHLHFDPESRLINFVLEKASLLNDPALRRIGFVAFSYAAISLAEGVGLYLEKAWGEFLTLAITASFLPWEMFEIFRRITWPRVGLLTINVLIFIYLLQLVLDRARRRAKGSRK
jgi:uncharacterized membrane protein (DUF2068 family)